jgi:Type ISP C-terminal specificity domain/N-6 DNA Methylase
MTTTNHRVKAALETYANTLNASYAVVGVNAGAEEQLKAPVKALIEACADLAPRSVASRPARVVALLETSIEGTGRPDVGVTLDALLNGYIELKAPDKGADPSKLKDKHDKTQWSKFQLLPNIAYTNGREWRLYRTDGSGAKLIGSIKLGDYIARGAAAVTDGDAQAFAGFIQTFLTWKVITPTTAKGLATLLAPLAKLFRQEVSEALTVRGSRIQNGRDIWKQTLFPRATDEQFADIYAQTVTYAMLLARLDGADLQLAGSAVNTLSKGHELLAETLKILTDDKLKAELGSGLETLVRVIQALDNAVFKSQSEALWLYFYEYFLFAYDPALRNKYGVYYTPLEVVGVQVRLVDEVLKTRLGKAEGYADGDVLLLDPATGTGAYPLAVIEHALAEARSYGPGMVPQVASKLAQTIHAFELLVGPYAVAHLRLSQAIQNAKGVLPADGAHVYLNDTLESPHATNPTGLPFMLEALTTEHERAQAVKLKTQITVTLGNPPYDRHDAKDKTRGGWIRGGNLGDQRSETLLEDFFAPVRDAGEGGHLKNLYNDYVYFWRWALWKTFENPGTPESPQPVPRPGVVCFITAASYLRGPGFIGMREVMRRTFSELWIIDLEGDNLGARKTENVFAIQTPVCIALGVKLEGNDPDAPATVRYTRLTGTRSEKLAQLTGVQQLSDLGWRETMSGWGEPFLPGGEGAYWTWPKLTDIFPVQFSGMQLKRTWPIAETKKLAQHRWDTLKSAAPGAQPALFRETAARRVAHTYFDIHDVKLKPITAGGSVEIKRYAFRSFDRQWVIADERFADRFRPDLWRAHGAKQVYLVSMLTKDLGFGLSSVATNHIPDLHYFAGRGGKDVVPLYLDAAGTEPNVTPGLLEVLEAQYGVTVTAEDLFAYSYALLSTPAYIVAHADDLSVPGPRLPITKDHALFTRGASLGRTMLNLHTYGERFAGAGSGTAYRGKALNTKPVPSLSGSYPDRQSLEGETLKIGEGEFAPVSVEVYNYSISGLLVLQSWIKYRLKSGYGKRSSPLDALRPDVWTPEMSRELLELIWLLERTLELEPAHTAFLTHVEASELFVADDLPKPAKKNDDESETDDEDDPDLQPLDFGV